MSFSFGFRESTKERARTRVQLEMDNIVSAQPVHAKDKELALATFESYLSLISDDALKPEVTELQVSMSGSLSGRWSGGELPEVTSASLSVSVFIVDIPVKN